MPRNEVEFCMFCSPGPCECAQKPDRKSKPKLPDVLPVTTVSPVTTASSPPVPMPVSPEPKRTGLVNTDAAKAAMKEESDFRYAVTLLCTSGLVSAASVAENIDYLDMSSLQAKTLIWKLKRQEHLGEVK